MVPFNTNIASYIKGSPISTWDKISLFIGTYIVLVPLLCKGYPLSSWLVIWMVLILRMLPYTTIVLHRQLKHGWNSSWILVSLQEETFLEFAAIVPNLTSSAFLSNRTALFLSSSSSIFASSKSICSLPVRPEEKKMWSPLVSSTAVMFALNLSRYFSFGSELPYFIL